jgi:hypothetical protein
MTEQVRRGRAGLATPIPLAGEVGTVAAAGAII